MDYSVLVIRSWPPQTPQWPVGGWPLPQGGHQVLPGGWPVLMAAGPHHVNVGGQCGHHITVPTTWCEGKAQQFRICGNDGEVMVNVEEEAEPEVSHPDACHKKVVSSLQMARAVWTLAITATRVEAGHPGSDW